MNPSPSPNRKAESFAVTGMTCASCTTLIEHELRKISSFSDVRVDYADERVDLVGDDTRSFLTLSNDQLAPLGYELVPFDQKEEAKERHQKKLKRQMMIFLSIGSFFMLAMWWIHHSLLYNAIQVAVALVLTVGWGKKYLYSIIKGPLTFSMDYLLGLGLAVTSLHSVLLLIQEGAHAHLFAESVPFILGLSSLSQYLESKALYKVKWEAANLLKLQVKFAVLDDSGEKVPVVQLKVGDAIRVRPGQVMPIDGLIVKGQSMMNEQTLTGEARLRPVKEGDAVWAQTLVIDGSLVVKSVKNGLDNQVTELIQSIRQKEKLEVEEWSDLVMKFFIPFVFVTSLFFFFYKNTASAVAVLLVACPCAISLAPSLGLVIAKSKMKKRGIEASKESFEKTSKVTTLFFDKTGTLTKGSPIVRQSTIDSSHHAAIHALSSLSSHPLSKAISRYTSSFDQGLEPDSLSEVPGEGLTGFFNGQTYYLGKAKMDINREESEFGQVAFYVNDVYSGSFLLEDEWREDTFDVIQELKKKYNIKLLSGDLHGPVKKAADYLGIDYRAQVTPLQKKEEVEKAKASGEVVAMIGDGLNDMAAVASADVSMAMAQGAEITAKLAQLVLTSGQLADVSFVLSESKRAMNVIKSNMIWALLYNTVAMPLAGLGLVSVHWAAILMGLSSLSVILNSQRLLLPDNA